MPSLNRDIFKNILFTATVVPVFPFKDLRSKAKLRPLIGELFGTPQVDLHSIYSSNRTQQSLPFCWTKHRIRRNRFRQVHRRKRRKLQKQDIQPDRALTDNYVTGVWLKRQFCKVRHDCGDCFRFDIKDGEVESNLKTVDRVDNDECHHLNNIVPLCVTCNQRESCW
jgi:hypothetical protein